MVSSIQFRPLWTVLTDSPAVLMTISRQFLELHLQQAYSPIWSFNLGLKTATQLVNYQSISTYQSFFEDCRCGVETGSRIVNGAAVTTVLGFCGGRIIKTLLLIFRSINIPGWSRSCKRIFPSVWADFVEEAWLALNTWWRQPIVYTNLTLTPCSQKTWRFVYSLFAIFHWVFAG